MGIADFFSDLYSSMGFPEAHADAPPEDKEDGDSKEGGDDDKADGEGDEKAEGGDEEAGGDEEGGEEEPEEEEEEEPVDAKPKLEEDCVRSAQCSGWRHHYEECAQRVTYQQENPDQFKGHKEDCVEEFFHLQHCASQCAAPKLFKILK